MISQSDGADGHIRLDQQGLLDGVHGMYVEGSLSFAVMHSNDGTDVLVSPPGLEGRFDEPVTLLDADVSPGTYVVEAYQRPCDGSCEILDPITERCTTEITIEPESLLRLLYTFTPGVACSLTIE